MNILIIYKRLPEPDKASGDLRLVEIIKLLKANGHNITFLAHSMNQGKYYELLLKYVNIVIKGVSRKNILSIFYLIHTFWKYRYKVVIYVDYIMYLKYSIPIKVLLPKSKSIIDTIDLHFVRLEREVKILGTTDLNLYEQKVAEIDSYRNSDCIWVITNIEKKILVDEHSFEDEKIHVMPNIHIVKDNLKTYNERNGIVFLGGYRHEPNIDAVDYFINYIFKYILEEIINVKLSIVGSHPPERFNNYSKFNQNIVVTGFVQDHREVLSTHLIGIAPLRYGAGMKGKIGEYLACGLPCVSTSIGVEGMNLKNEEEVLVANDPVHFSSNILRLYNDKRLWEKLSKSGLKYIENDLSPKAFKPGLINAIDKVSMSN